MLKLYCHLALRSPSIGSRAFKTFEGWVAIFLFGVLFYNKEVAQKFTEWKGVHRVWCLVPIVLLLLHGLFRETLAYGQKGVRSKGLEQLTDLMSEGGALLKRLKKGCADEASIADCNQWIASVDAVSDRLGTGHRVRVSDFSDFTFYGDGSERSKKHIAINGRMRRLNEFIKELHLRPSGH